MLPYPDIVYDYNIACIGDTMIECILPLGELPGASIPVVLDSVRQQFGGSAFNLCWYLAQLGHQASLIGPYGFYNQALVADALLSAQLSSSGLVETEHDTDLLIIMSVEDRQHTIYIRSEVSEAVCSRMVSNCTGIPYVVLTGSRHPQIRQAQVYLASQREGSSLAFSPSYPIYEFYREELEALLQRSHVIIFNEHEASYIIKLMGMSSEVELAEYVPRCLIITRAERGAELYEHGVRISIKSYSNYDGNFVGAGDAFLAGFLHHFLTGSSLDDAARFGAALAACGVDAHEIRVKVTEAEIASRLISGSRKF